MGRIRWVHHYAPRNPVTASGGDVLASIAQGGRAETAEGPAAQAQYWASRLCRSRSSRSGRPARPRNAYGAMLLPLPNSCGCSKQMAPRITNAISGATSAGHPVGRR